ADSSAWVRYSIIQGIGGGHAIREVSLRAVRPFDSDSDVIVENERLVRAENRDDVIKLVPNVIDPTNLRSRNGGLLRAILYAADSVILQIRNHKPIVHEILADTVGRVEFGRAGGAVQVSGDPGSTGVSHDRVISGIDQSVIRGQTDRVIERIANEQTHASNPKQAARSVKASVGAQRRVVHSDRTITSQNGMK